MARFNLLQTINIVVSTGIVPVFYHKDPEVAKNVLKSCYEGGIRVFEFTNRGDFAHEVFLNYPDSPPRNARNWYWASDQW